MNKHVLRRDCPDHGSQFVLLLGRSARINCCPKMQSHEFVTFAEVAEEFADRARVAAVNQAVAS